MANIVFVAAVFCIYCFVVASSLQIRRWPVRYLVFLIAAVPIGIGYVLGTVGALGAGFIVADYARPPISTEQMGPQLICEITGWGSAVSASGYTVHLYRSWPGIPFIQREVASLSVTETGGIGEPDPAKTCADALNAYRH